MYFTLRSYSVAEQAGFNIASTRYYTGLKEVIRLVAFEMNIFHLTNKSNGTFDIGNSIVHKKTSDVLFLGKNENIVILCHVF